jgi:predicted Zn-dependent protease
MKFHTAVIILTPPFAKLKMRVLPLPANRSYQRWFLAILCVVAAFSANAQQADPEKLIDAGHWKKARVLVEARRSQSPNDALANFLLSQIHNAFGDYTSPLPLAEKAVALDGHVAKYHRQLAEALGLEAQHAGALRLIFLARQFRSEIDLAISLDPRDIQAHRDLLEYYLVAPGIAGGDLQKATAMAKQIGFLDAAEGLLAEARVASFRKRFGDAGELLRQASALQPPNYRARLALAQYYSAPESFNPVMASNAAEELLKLDPGRVEPYAILAQVYAEQCNWNALDSLLSEATQHNSDDLTPYYRAAETLLAEGREPARAARYLRVYLEHEPEGNEPTLADARRKLAAAN